MDIEYLLTELNLNIEELLDMNYEDFLKKINIKKTLINDEYKTKIQSDPQNKNKYIEKKKTSLQYWNSAHKIYLKLRNINDTVSFCSTYGDYFDIDTFLKKEYSVEEITNKATLYYDKYKGILKQKYKITQKPNDNYYILNLLKRELFKMLDIEYNLQLEHTLLGVDDSDKLLLSNPLSEDNVKLKPNLNYALRKLKNFTISIITLISAIIFLGINFYIEDSWLSNLFFALGSSFLVAFIIEIFDIIKKNNRNKNEQIKSNILNTYQNYQNFSLDTIMIFMKVKTNI